MTEGQTARMKVALAQINTTVGDLAGNEAKILDALRRGSEAGADLVMFPELAITGYPPRDLLLKKGFHRRKSGGAATPGGGNGPDGDAGRLRGRKQEAARAAR